MSLITRTDFVFLPITSFAPPGVKPTG